MLNWIKKGFNRLLFAFTEAEPVWPPEISEPYPHQILWSDDDDIWVPGQTIHLLDPKRKVCSNDRRLLAQYWNFWSDKNNVPATFKWAHRRGCDALAIIVDPGYDFKKEHLDHIFSGTEDFLRLWRIDFFSGEVLHSRLYPQYGYHVKFDRIVLFMRDEVLFKLRAQAMTPHIIEHGIKWKIGGCRGTPPCSPIHIRTVSDNFKECGQ